MTSVLTSRRHGVNGSLAIKAPCKSASIANLTLSGEQTVDGVALVTGDRVLVKDQTTASENGIYAVNTSTWQREPDWDGARDVKKGTLVYVTDGSTTVGYWSVTTSDPITPGTTSVTIAAGFRLVNFPAESGETGITDYSYPPGDVRRYGAVGSPANDTTAFQNAAVSVNGGTAGAGTGGAVDVPDGTWLVDLIGMRGTVFRGESMKGTIIKPYSAYVSGPQYLFDAAIDRDGSTANTAGNFGAVQNMTLDGDSKGWHGVNTYGGGVDLNNLQVTGFVDGVSLGLPIWSNVRNVYSYSNTGKGFYTYAGAGDNGTSTVFENCWADSNGTYGWHITQMYYSTWIACAGQNSTTNEDWYFEGNANGLSACYSNTMINCASEGANGIPFLIKKQRDIHMISPRIISAPTTVDLITMDDSTGTITDYTTTTTPGGSNYHISALNVTGGDNSIRIVGGDVTYAAAQEPYFAALAAKMNGDIRTDADRLFHYAANVAEQMYSEIADIDGYKGVTLYDASGTRVFAVSRVGVPVFGTGGNAIITPATYLNNGDISFSVGTTTLTFTAKGTDGTVRTGTVTLA